MVERKPRIFTMDEMPSTLRFLGIGIRSIDDPYYHSTYKVCNLAKRVGITCNDQEDSWHNLIDEFQCNIIGCKEKFKTLLDYEIHYNGSHRYVCQNCKKTLPTPRFLDIHIQETHDTFFQVMAEKQPMYQCYVSECEWKFMNVEDRKSHCISMHKFPKRFRYEELVKQKCKTKEDNSMETNQIEKEHSVHKGKKKSHNSKHKQSKVSSKSKIDDKIVNTNNSTVVNIQSNSNSASVSTSSSLMFLPRQVQQKSFAKVLTKSEKNTEKNVLESDSIMDMAEVLPNIKNQN